MPISTWVDAQQFMADCSASCCRTSDSVQLARRRRRHRRSHSRRPGGPREDHALQAHVLTWILHAGYSWGAQAGVVTRRTNALGRACACLAGTNEAHQHPQRAGGEPGRRFNLWWRRRSGCCPVLRSNGPSDRTSTYSPLCLKWSRVNVATGERCSIRMRVFNLSGFPVADVRARMFPDAIRDGEPLLEWELELAEPGEVFMKPVRYLPDDPGRVAVHWEWTDHATCVGLDGQIRTRRIDSTGTRQLASQPRPPGSVDRSCPTHPRGRRLERSAMPLGRAYDGAKVVVRSRCSRSFVSPRNG